MNNNINYTIIIPHYNIPDLLVRCLNSIPVREDVQVIVVDDCSPCQGQTFKMLQDLKRPYLEWYSTPMGGSAGRARNVGLDQAKGKWLIFADADDFFTNGFAECIDQYKNASEDIIFFNTKSVYSTDITKESKRDKRDNLFQQYATTRYKSVFRCSIPVLWGKFFKRDLVVSYNVRCDETKYSNDLYFSVLVDIKAKDILIVDKVIYVVTDREKSLSNQLCATYEEWKIRYAVSKRVQSIIKESPYHSMCNQFVKFYLMILYLNYHDKFWSRVLHSWYKPYNIYLGFVLLRSNPWIVPHEIKAIFRYLFKLNR